MKSPNQGPPPDTGGPGVTPDAYPGDAFAKEVIEGVEDEVPEAELTDAPAPIDDEVRSRAHKLWVEAGRPKGGPAAFWEQAEQDILEGSPEIDVGGGDEALE